MLLTLLTTAILLSPQLEVTNRPVHVFLARTTIAIIAPYQYDAINQESLVFIESRYNPAARSPKNACGLFQQQPQWKNTTCRSLQTKPIHAALIAISSIRDMQRLCGKQWLKCYQKGPYHPDNRLYLRFKRIPARLSS